MYRLILCPDGKTQDIKECLAGKCRMEERCAPLSYLSLAARERVWKGIPSVTQLIDGTRRQYLLLTTDTTLNPDKAAFRVLGTKGHASLDDDNDLSFTEEKFESTEIHGTADLLELQMTKLFWLGDYKTSGSYKVAKALGMVKKQEPICDENGNQLKHKNGKPQFKRWFEFDNSQRDVRDWALQLNKYRIELEKRLGEKIPRLKVFCIVRDGNTVTAKGRGILRNTYYLDIPLLPDAEVEAYFSAKRTALLDALATGIMPEECTPEEAWGGNKCKDCEVREACAKAGRSYVIKEEEEE